MPEFNTATVIDIHNQANHFYLFTCKAEQPFTFIPGQYIIVQVNSSRVVQYSIASPPHPDNQTFQLLIQYLPGGEGSEWTKQRQVGDTFNFIGPLGNFTFNNSDATKVLLFVATGSGIAPFMSIIPNLLTNHETRPLRLYWGLRYRDHLIYVDLLEQWETQYPNFKRTVCISKPDQQRTTPAGRVTQFLNQDITNGQSLSAYLCGSEHMISDVSQVLLNKGIRSQHIYHEKFW